jgi:hypothetical protein
MEINLISVPIIMSRALASIQLLSRGNTVVRGGAGSGGDLVIWFTIQINPMMSARRR